MKNSALAALAAICLAIILGSASGYMPIEPTAPREGKPAREIGYLPGGYDFGTLCYASTVSLP